MLKGLEGGKRKHAGLAGVFSQTLYESVSEFGDWVIPEFGGLLIAEAMGNCEDYLMKNV